MINSLLKPLGETISEIGESISDIRIEIVDFFRDIRFNLKTVVIIIAIWIIIDILFKSMLLMIFLANI